MRNPIFEVTRTYWRRSISSWVAMLAVFPPLVIPGAFLMEPRTWGNDLNQVFAILTYYSLLLWLHFREQVLNERRLLWPHGARPHVVVFSILATLILLLPQAILFHDPAQIGRMMDYYGWPKGLWNLWQSVAVILAFTSLSMAVVGLWVLTGSRLLLALGIFFATIHVTDHKFLGSLFWKFPTVAQGVLLVSLITIVLTVRRMIRLTEDDAAYHGRPWMTLRTLRPRMTGEGNRAWTETIVPKIVARQASGESTGNDARESALAGARRWLSAYPDSLLTIFFLAALLVGANRMLLREHLPPAVAFLWSILLPVGIIHGAWLQRWRHLEVELLRPIDRPSYIKQLGVAMAINVLQVWVIFATAILIDALIPSRQPIAWTPLIISLGASLALQTLGFGVVIWMMRYRSLILVTGSIVAQVAIAGAILSFINAREKPYPFSALAAALALGAIGVFIVRDAYRRWLVMELGG